jgi:eukaryotic-like serine/threonine-protein kinase
MLCPRCHRRYEAGAAYCSYDGDQLTDRSEIELIDAQPSSENGAVYGKRYIVRGLLGGGSMGRIYLAENAFSHEPVAIKVLEHREAKLEDPRARFLREARTIEALEHANIVRLLDAGTRPDGAPYLVMEYLYGESLGTRLKKNGRLEPREALWTAHQVAGALAAAHSAGVIHRDVKPDNVFLVGELGNPHGLKLVDFGLARLSGASALTAMGVTVGTLAYMAPEQAVRDATGPRTDIYALGVMMYRMVSGKLPFEGSDFDTLAQHVVTPARPLPELVPGIDPRIEAIVSTAMRKLPRNRYSTASELVEDLERVLAKRPGELGAGQLWEPDHYRPRSAYAKSVAAALYRKLGLEPPSWG